MAERSIHNKLITKTTNNKHLIKKTTNIYKN